MFSRCLKAVSVGCMLWACGMLVYAQEPTPDSVTNTTISYNQVVEDTITDDSIYDWYHFSGVQGDQILARMVAADGLVPLLGISDTNGDIVIRSDTPVEGQQIDAEVNGVAELEFTLPADGQYTLVSTRAGNASGTTTGSYTLSLILEAPAAPKDLQDVVFRCDAYEITTAATLEFGGEGDSEDNYQITVYGLDGFQPYIRVDLPYEGGVTDCSSDGSPTIGDEYTLPGEERVTVTEGSPYTARHNLVGMQEIGRMTLVIGSRDGAAGRYVAVIEGFKIDPAGDVDLVDARLGPLAAESEMLIYMLRDQRTRLDPMVQMQAQNPEVEFTCDDAGRRDCDLLPSATEYNFKMNEDAVITGDRLDAGVRVATGNPERVKIGFGSRTSATGGGYTVVIVGELPSSSDQQ